MIGLKKPPLKLLKRKFLYKNPFLSFYVDFLEIAPKKVLEHVHLRYPPSVGIAALTKKNEILLVEQYRYILGKTVLELPCGSTEKGESLKKCASRELVEETGHKGKKFKKLFSFNPSDGTSNQEVFIFKAQAKKTRKKPSSVDEFLTVKKMPLEHALKKIKEGQIKDAGTIIAILYLILEKMRPTHGR